MLADSKVIEENKRLKEKMKSLEFELETQKNLTMHYEGIAYIMSAELKKVQRVEAMSKSVRLGELFVLFDKEMKDFLTEKQQLFVRFSRIESLYNSIVAILKN